MTPAQDGLANETPTTAQDPYRQLIALCRAGRLFEVEEWYKSGKPTQPPTPNRRPTPIGVAIEKGFHSLVEVLLRHGVKPTGRVLYDAVRRDRADIVELLFRYGADANSIRFEDVVCTYNPEIVRMFVEGGADLVTDYPVAEGFKTATKPMLRIYRHYVERFPALKLQASIALRHFCREGSLRGVCLLLWVGADPRTKVPEAYGDDDAEMWESALWQAVSSGQLEIVKKIGIEPKKDNLNELLSAACSSDDESMIRHMIESGADPNAEASGVQAPLDALLWQLDCAVSFASPGMEWLRADDPIRCIKLFIKLGGKWRPRQEKAIPNLRSCLYRLSPGTVVDLAKLFKQHDFCSDEVIIELLNTPKMREHLRKQYQFKGLHKLIPFFKKWLSAGRAAQAERSSGSPSAD